MRVVPINRAEPAVVLIPRTCSQCGRPFGAEGRENRCPTCRRPKREAGLKGEYRKELSFRERQIIGLLRQAKPNKEIAFELRLTEGTIKEYLHHIFRKTGCANRTDLALRTDAELLYLYVPPSLRQ